MRPSQTILVLEDLRTRFAGPLHRKGVVLSHNDSQTVLDVYQQWLLLLIDLGYLHPGTLYKDAHRLLSDMIKADVLDLNNAFAELSHLVRLRNFRGFKGLCKQISTHLYNFVKEDMRNCELGDVYSAKRLLQAFAYTSRLTLNDIDLTQECLESYMAVESEMSDYLPHTLIRPLNKIIKRWMESFDPDSMKFHHGPGGVAGHGRTTLQNKYKDLTSDALLDYVFEDKVQVFSQIRSNLDRISHTIFVPKSYKTFRTISMEPATLMYYQQGIWGEIDRLVADSRYLRNRIGFHEQERNQRLAKEGSISRNYATIDLSAASDSVSYKLVKKLFSKTKLLPFIRATRSKRTLLPDGRIVTLKKFAPMGSALCFPIETIIFAAICEFVTREHGVNGDYSVFGDDIIVPTHCVEDVVYVLDTLGFRVNHDKSFYHSDCWFRESCGAEYCDGFDVTPMRVSRKYNHKEQLVRLSGLIDLANRAYESNFRHLRQFFLKKLRDADFIALFSPKEVYADNFTNYHTDRRWEKNLHRIECRVTTLCAQERPGDCEDIRYFHWLNSNCDREVVGIRAFRSEKPTKNGEIIEIVEPFQSMIGRTTVSTRNRWRAKPHEEDDNSFIAYCAFER